MKFLTSSNVFNEKFFSSSEVSSSNALVVKNLANSLVLTMTLHNFGGIFFVLPYVLLGMV